MGGGRGVADPTYVGWGAEVGRGGAVTTGPAGSVLQQTRQERVQGVTDHTADIPLFLESRISANSVPCIIWNQFRLKGLSKENLPGSKLVSYDRSSFNIEPLTLFFLNALVL